MKSIYIKILFISVLCLFCHNVAFCQEIEITNPLPIGTTDNPTSVEPNVTINWNIDNNSDRPAVVQVYLYGDLIFPKNNPHKESMPGSRLELEPENTYEIKLWVPRTMINTSTWVSVINTEKKEKILLKSK